MLNKHKNIFVAGHNGLVGSAVIRKLKEKGYKKILYSDKKSLNLLNQRKVENFFKNNHIDVVIIAAARVGGINANNIYKGNFIYENLQIQNNLIHTSYINGIKNLIFLGSSCIYPKYVKKPIKENSLLSGKLEETNEPYAIAKIAGVKLCEFYNYQYKTNYKCLMPCNLFGPNDNYDLNDSHFLPALIKKVYDCKINKKKSLEIWGTGKPRRELMFVDDLADAIVFFVEKKTKESLINIGSNYEKTILEYAKNIIDYFDLNLQIKFNKSKPDGVFSKVLDSSLSKKYKWKPQTDFKTALSITIKDFLDQKQNKIKSNLST